MHATRAATRNSWAELTEEEQQDDERVQDDEGADGDDADMGDGQGDPRDDEQGEEEVAGGPTEAELRSTWMEHCALLRRLEKGDHPTPPGVLASVRAQRDEAERRWRAAKTPHPLSKRLRWAENELRAAEAKEAARRRELDEHLAQAALRTKEIEGRLEADVARSARKRDALHTLRREAAIDERPAVDKAARVAIAGIGTDIAPALSAIIEQLGEEQQGLRQDLQLLSTSLGRVEGVLRDATEQDLDRDQLQPTHQQQPAVFDISGDAMGGDDGGRRGDGGDDDAEGTRKARRLSKDGDAAVAAAPRWTKPAANAPWQKAQTSATAVSEARRLLQSVGTAEGGDGGPKSPADTNDLPTAERLAREQAVRQQQEALQQQPMLHLDPARAMAEEQQRQLREQRRQEELHRHQEAAAKAAAAAAAEEARRKEELWANMPPAQREQARKLHEQQMAVGAHIFGSPEAGQLAGIVHQTHVQERVGEHAAHAGGWDEQEVQHLMGMSPEDFARWDTERQSLM